MFLGHHAAAFAGKRFAPRVSLGTLFLAATLLDLVWPLLLLLGLEHVRIAPGITRVTPLDFYDYPYTHSLALVLVWSLLFGTIYYALRRRSAFVVGALVLSHWILDLVTHRPDLPLWPGGPKVGLGLWNSFAATILIEGAIFILGVVLYVRTTVPRDRTGSVALAALIAFSAGIGIVNFIAPPPPDPMAIGWGGLAAWLFIPWGYWIDRHREVRT